MLRLPCLHIDPFRLALLIALGSFATRAGADESAPSAAKPAAAADAKAAAPAAPAPKFPDWNKVTEGAKKLEGLFPLYYNEKDQKLFLEIRRDQYNQDLILPISIARGAGTMYLGGDTLNFGNQWILSFQRTADRILVIRRNVRVKADSGSPQADSVKVSYNDSVIAALPIKAEQENGNKVLVDLADLLMTDLAGIGVTPDKTRSTWAKVKAFPQNLEIEVSAVFNMSRGFYYFFYGGDSIADPRGAQIVIHYGLSKLEDGGYKTRVADDRVGHFLSTVQDFSTDIRDAPRVRYVTRWNLEKSNASAERSAPKKPIVFWIEKTVPREYRPYVRAGILEWNKAFDKLGFIEAIQAREQTELDDFDPEDIRYNTFRWITTSVGFAMGPSRTNPKTGQILDADIVFDEGMIRYWRGEFLRTRGIPEAMSLVESGQRQAFFKLYSAHIPELAGREQVFKRLAAEHKAAAKEPGAAALGFARNGAGALPPRGCECCMMGQGMQRQIGLMAAMMAARGTIEPGGKVPEAFIGQAIKEVVMHEVGHTLGLRHNFKSSTFISLKDANNPEVTRAKGMTGSVMDYAPANFASKGEKQGDYFSDTIGPYDYWAIEYAYKPVKGDEKEELEKIAARSSTGDLIYATDEDMWMNPDPRINAFDLGDPLEYSIQRVRLMKESLEKLEERVVAKGEGWQRARQAFSMLLGELSSAAYLSSQYVGGQYTSRAHREEPDAKVPVEPIPLAKQREAIKLLKEEILSDGAFKFSPELLKRLAPEHFMDDDYYFFFSSDYQFPLYETVLSIQRIVLARFLDSQVLRSIQNAELLASSGQEVLKMPEVFDTLTDAIWSELPPPESASGEKKKIEISTIRRNLQREHVKRLSNMVLGPRNDFGTYDYFFFFDYEQPAPADAKALARHHLKAIDARIAIALDAQKAEPDAYSRAHLEQLHDQIGKVLAAELKMNEP
jgi:hypothetical protein